MPPRARKYFGLRSRWAEPAENRTQNDWQVLYIIYQLRGTPSAIRLPVRPLFLLPGHTVLDNPADSRLLLPPPLKGSPARWGGTGRGDLPAKRAAHRCLAAPPAV